MEQIKTVWFVQEAFLHNVEMFAEFKVENFIYFYRRIINTDFCRKNI